MLIVEQKGSTS